MRHELEADPEDDGPRDEQEREQELRVRVRDLADPARAALGGHRRAQDDVDHQDDDDRPRSRTGSAAGRRPGRAARADASRRPTRRKWSPSRRGYDGCAPHPSSSPRRNPDVTPFERLGRFVVHRAWWVVGAWAALLLIALPFAPQVPGQLSAGGFILDDLESARAKALLETELGAPPSALVVVFSSPTLEAGTPAFEVAAADAIRDVGTAPHVARVVSHLLSPRQISERRPHRLRHRLPRPAARRFARRAADPARAPAAGARARRRAGRRARLLRRRPDRLGGGPAPERDDLAAAGGARPDLRLRFAGRRRRPARSSVARRSSSRWAASSLSPRSCR